MEKMMTTTTKPDFINSAPKLELDVRPSLASGVDPFSLIMKNIDTLKDGEILHLINTFEPLPLYNVLAKRGFSHFTENIDGIFNVYFFKNDVGYDTQADEKPSFSKIDTVVEIDVRELTPPEPMMVILEKLRDMDEKSILLVHHHREPMMLYEKLDEIGWEAVTNKINDNYFKVVITRKL